MPGKRSLILEALGGRPNAPAKPGHRNLINETFGMGAGAAPSHAASSAALHQKQEIPLTVRVRYRDRPDFIWHGVSHAGDMQAHLVATRNDQGAWEWDDSAGETIRIYRNAKDKSGSPISVYMTKTAFEVHVDFGDAGSPGPDTTSTSANSGGRDPSKDATSSTSSASHKDPSSSSASDRPAPAPSSDVATSGDWTELPDAADAQAVLDQGKDATKDQHPPSSSKGTDPNATREGQSDGTGDAEHIGMGGRTGGSDGGEAGNTADTGRADGQHGGGDDASLVHNDNAETGEAANANIPEDGAKAGGHAGGEAGKGNGGVAGAGALWKLIAIPGAIAGVVELGMILKQADLTGLSDGLVGKAMAGFRGKALKAVIEADIERFAAHEVAALEKDLEKIPDWEYLSDAAKASKRAQMRYAVKDSVARSVARDLDQRIAQLESDLKAFGKDAEKGEGAAAAIEDMKADLKAAQRTREALKDFGPKPGTGSFRELEDRGAKEAQQGVKDGGKAATDDAEASWARTRQYWTTETEFNGMKVYRRDDLIDPNLVTKGETNMQKMERGVAPIGPDGEPLQLHHLNQANEGPIAEVTASFHSSNSDAIHINSGSKIPSGIDRDAFASWKRQYWMNRAATLKP